MFDVPCVIFAGGRSSRMGEDKSLLPFSSSATLTQHQLQKLQKLFKNVYVSCKTKDKFSFDANFIEDVPTQNVFAPTTGFIAIFKELKEERVFVISVDSPFVSDKEIYKILDADDDSFDATVAVTDAGTQPMCGVYHRSLESKFIQMLKEDNHKLNFLLKNSNTKYVRFDDERAFLNLNNPDEYRRALTLV